MEQLSAINVTCPISELHTIESEIQSAWCLINRKLTSTITNNTIHNDNLLRYIDICSTIGVLNDEKVIQYISNAELQSLRTRLTTEQKALRDLLEVNTNPDDAKRGDKNRFEHFDKVMSIVLA